VRQLKESEGRDITVGGPDLAAQAIKAGLVDEWHLFITPTVVGGGTRALPDNVRLELELLDERRFGNGVVYLRYRTRTQAA
jgi:riboflavin biosynthesis pyrimidine reductase